MSIQQRYRWQWYQSPTTVSVEIFVKGTRGKEDKVETSCEEKAVTVRVDDGHEDGPYVLKLHLFGKIKPEETKVELLSSKIEVKLYKSEGGAQWADLEDSDHKKQRVENEEAHDTASSLLQQQKKKTPKDWEKLESELKELEKEEKPEGEAALQALFKDIYAKADEDTQRAMMKSFQESNGTVLSTNWNEVGKKKVEIQPPEGMEAKAYEQ